MVRRGWRVRPLALWRVRGQCWSPVLAVLGGARARRGDRGPGMTNGGRATW